MPVGEGSDFGGAIHVRLDVRGARVRAVNIRSTRLQAASQVLLGHTPSEATAMIGRLFSLCSQAQTIAGLQALEQAGQVALSTPHAVARTLLRQAEMLSQTALRLGMGWPKVLGVALAPEVVRACLGAEQKLERAVFAGAPWKVPGGVTFAPDLDAVHDSLVQLAVSIDKTMQHDGLADQLRHALAQFRIEGFGAGAVPGNHEDGALSRRWDDERVRKARHGHGLGLLARLEARLADMVCLPKDMSQAAATLASGEAAEVPSDASGTGCAVVETARGKLEHRVTLKDGLITSYAIAAPTDINFAPDGPVAMGLMGVDASQEDAMRRAAELHVLAVDPCVGCTVEVRHA